LTKDPTQQSELFQILKRAYAGLPNYKLQSFNLISLSKADPSADTHQQLGEKLLDLDLYDEAMPEIFASRATNSKSPNTQSSSFTDENYALAVYSLRGGLANRSVRF